MSTYHAPLAEMQFVMNELAGLAAGLEAARVRGRDARHGRRRFSTKPRSSRPTSSIRSTRPATAKARSCSTDGTVKTPAGFKEAYKQFCDNGWNGLTKNPEYGGQGLPQLVQTAVEEMWHASNLAFDLCPLLTQGAIEAIELKGSDELKHKYLPNMVAGTWTGTMNLTEPQAGSDLAAVRTRAVPQGDGTYKLFGQKIFITFGEHDYTENIIHLVLARTPDAPEGVKGISLFVVPKFLVNDDGSLGARNDVHCVSLEHKLGIHASPTAVTGLRRQGRRGRLSRRRGEPRPRVHVHHDEPRALFGGHGRRGHCPSARTSAPSRMRAIACRARRWAWTRPRKAARSSSIRTSGAC